MGTTHGEVAGCACWHALCRAKETGLVVAGVGTAHGEVAGVGAAHGEVAECACWHALCRAKEIGPVIAAGELSYCRMNRLPAVCRGGVCSFFEG